MQKHEAAVERNRGLFNTILVVVVFVALIAGFLYYLNDNAKDIRRLSFEKLADTFNASVNNAHWQWQAEGRPEKIVVAMYASQLSEEKTLIETEKQPMYMDGKGWPKVEESAKGCTKLWNMVLGFPLEVDGYEVVVNFHSGESLTGNKIDSTCRYQLLSGAYFDYKMKLGQVLKLEYLN
ncbi:hypothetical protein RS130_03520 [Paraglaciecola aquimarina]|uniref:MSHA biogenesis protein MshF n=1 Tax=Paraglaciecola aquimarina TaxID=1235557 RepID=A0ABU3ST17_9ALTE|nr:hypothetical protein [Paraglaciecola aquimarina]MDU0353122.1 hypothetical protein [Paraglaciecola aquimarina]